MEKVKRYPNRLLIVLKEKDVTILELSKRTKIARSTLSSIANWRKNAHLDTYYKIAKGLGVKVTDLICLDGYYFEQQ